MVPLAQIDSVADDGGSERRSEVHYIHTDHLGTPNEVTDEQGEIVWATQYKAWGNVLRVVQAAPKRHGLAAVEAEAANDVAQFQPIRFLGQYHDSETGLNYNRFRYYDADCGRYISQDPIGWNGGNNLYQYAANPSGWVDPLGLSPITVDPSSLNFSRSWVSANDYAAVMPEQGWIGDPLTVINRNGTLVSFDNRRLAAAQELGLKGAPVNIVNGSDIYPKSPNGKTWDEAFDKRLRENGLGQYGTSETPAIGKIDGKKRVQENRINRCGC
ncbi:RHS domain-containing protein [Massilia antarctica]|uniref:RHS domain-containing protein n=2 Tax=Massilia antarctica TaxID=2765360 RepID=A0AA48WJX7_9BURK|nr:RHS domain-containing protein [Massilia antarctica]